MNSRANLTFEQLADTGEMTARLSGSGLQAAAAADKADLLAYCAQALLEADVDDTPGLCAFFVPGRIELLGKHTDYAGGSSIVAAADRGFCVVASRRDDVAVRIFAEEDGHDWIDGMKLCLEDPKAIYDYSIRLVDLPRIFEDDPSCLALGGKEGDVIKIKNEN